MFSDKFVVVVQCHSTVGEGDEEIKSLLDIPKTLSAWQRLQSSVSGEH